MRILLVEDEQHLSEAVAHILKKTTILWMRSTMARTV